MVILCFVQDIRKSSDVNKDLELKDQDQDLALKDKDQDLRFCPKGLFMEKDKNKD